jgi:hypothetical protein
MKKMLVVVLMFVFISSQFLLSQTGGNAIYSFLNLNIAPRIASTGGLPLITYDNDVLVAMSNPSLLQSNVDNQLGLAYLNFFQGINAGNINYAKKYFNGTFSAGLIYFDYGNFEGRDETGSFTGNFRASDYALQLGYGNKIKKWQYGTSLKLIHSQLDAYNSVGVGLDLALSYVNDSNFFSTGFIMRNVGIQILAYDKSRETLPLEIIFGISKKLKHAPFRFGLTLHNLQRWDLTFASNISSENTIGLDGEEEQPKISFGDKLFRHAVLSTEIVLSKSFQIRLGYNHKRKREMEWENVSGFTGFSWGVGIRLKKLTFNYSNAPFFQGKTTNSFSLSLNLNDFRK